MTEHDTKQADREALAKHEGALAEAGAYPDDGATPYDAEEHRKALETEARERAEDDGAITVTTGSEGSDPVAVRTFLPPFARVGEIEHFAIGASAREEDRAARMEALARELTAAGAVVTPPAAMPIGVGMPAVRLEMPESAPHRRMSPAMVMAMAMAAGIAGGGVIGRRREVLTARHPGVHVLTDADRQRYSDGVQQEASWKRQRRGMRNLIREGKLTMTSLMLDAREVSRNITTAHEPNPPTLPLTKRVLVSMPPKARRVRKGDKRRARREAHASVMMGDGK